MANSRKKIFKITYGIILFALLFLFMASYMGRGGDSPQKGRVVIGLEHGRDRIIPTPEAIGSKAVDIAKGICKTKGWNWPDIRVHVYNDMLTLWHPSPIEGSDSVTVNTKTGKVIAELLITGVDETGLTSYTGKFYNKDGTSVVTQYRDDIPHGSKKTYYPHGVLKTDANFKNGKKDGPERRYDANGDVVEEIIWKDGVRIGENGAR